MVDNDPDGGVPWQAAATTGMRRFYPPAVPGHTDTPMAICTSNVLAGNSASPSSLLLARTPQAPNNGSTAASALLRTHYDPSRPAPSSSARPDITEAALQHASNRLGFSTAPSMVSVRNVSVRQRESLRVFIVKLDKAGLLQAQARAP